MQQQSTIPPYFFGIPQQYSQDGGGPTSHQWLPDNSKPNQYQSQWDNNGGFHVASGNNYGQAQVQGGGGQSRVQVSQQQQQPSQPTPTTTPPGIHGDMSKQPLMQNQQAQMSFIQTRSLNPNYAQFQRAAMQPTPQIRAHGRTQIVNNYMPIQGVIPTTPTLVPTAVPFPIMYGQTRAGPPYPNQGSYMIQQPAAYFNAQPTQHYFPQVISQPYPPGMSSGGPSPQAGGQQQQMQVMRQNIVSNTSAPVPMKQEPKRRPFALKIIHPDTNEEVPVDNETGGNNNNITPTRSNDSSARETPQPNAGVTVDNNTAADFAARVAALAMETEPPTPSDTVQDSIPVVISDSEVHHKQQHHLVPSSEKFINTVLSTSSEEFVPRSFKQPQPCEPPVVEERPQSPIVPTVSAETDSPAIEIQRNPAKEPFPALKIPAMPTAPVTQSPSKSNSKKQKSCENERQQASITPVSIETPLTAVENKDNSNKKGPKGAQKDEIVSLPKERREKTRSVSKEQSPALSPVTTQEIESSQPEVPSAPVVKVFPSAPPVSFTKESVKTNNVIPVEEPSVVSVSKIPQHQNGETPLADPPTVTVDGNKPRQKGKKTGKMRDLNRKGIEKEGSEMDAFTTETTIDSEERERPATPSSPSLQTKLPIPPSSPPPTIEHISPPPSSAPVDKIKEDLEEKEDKLVAAKNEENTKVSALSKPLEEPAPVIEKPVPQLTLRHSYRKDQWSPLNPEGKKKYEREFLLELKYEPQCNLKPVNLPDVVAAIRDSSNNMRNQNMSYMNRDMGIVMNPQFLQRSSQSQKGMVTKRGSQQGNKGRNNPKLIQFSLSLNEDVKLKTAENAWKPTRLVAETEKSVDDQESEELYKNVRGILNKLTPQKFDTLMKKFMILPINSEERLTKVINLIFDKAVDEPNFSKAYANMCKMCSKLEVVKLESGQEQKVNFRKILITRCQNEFESKSSELDTDKWLEEIKNCNDPEKKKELQSTYGEKERQLRMKSVGNIRFIGELFKLTMLTPAIMYRCIEHLLQTPEEESLECLCKLLTTIGKDLESNSKNPQVEKSLNPYFQKMYDLAQKKDGSKVSSRVRFMLQDVIELRSSKWVPRREDNNPKTIEQINREAERESIEMTLALNQPPPRMNRQNDRQDDRKRGNRGNINNNQSDDGWSTVAGGSRFHHKYNQVFEASKMQNFKHDVDVNSVCLGGSSQFRMFNTTPKSVDNKPFTHSNPFSTLQASTLQGRGDERKPPQNQLGMSNRRVITPTPSIEKEKERTRMIQGIENEGRNSRGRSAQRDRPLTPSQPPSRDSSIPRQPLPERDNREATEAPPKVKQVDNVGDTRAAEEKLERQTNTIFEEYLAECSTLEEVRQDIEQLYRGDKLGDFVYKALQISLEKKAGAQKRIGLLISYLMDFKLFSPDILIDQLSLIYADADDIAIDVPKVWELQAHVIVPIITAENINFNHFKKACSTVLKTGAAPKLLIPVLNFLVQEKGEGFVRKVWDSSNVSLEDFLPADTNLDTFIKENSLVYLTEDAPKYDSSSSQVSMDQVQEKMLRLMQSNQPYENILDFISSNVGEEVDNLHFIHALISAICEACLIGTRTNLEETKFTNYKKLIQRYVDNKEDKELACLSSVHNLTERLQYPQGLLKNIFNHLLEESLVSVESFLKWRDSDDVKLENKGVSLMYLHSFFLALQEIYTDGEENS